MHDRHLVESLRIDIDFAQLPAGPSDGEQAQSCLASFMRGGALAIVDAAFDDALPMAAVWRIDSLDVDLGRIVVEEGQDWQAAWSRALRAQLRRRLDELRDAPADGSAGPAARHPMHRRQSQLEALLYFLRHGRMPWYGRGGRADDPRELARDVLRHSPRALAAALREGADRPRLLQRLAAQFDEHWLTALVQALLPTEPTAVARLLDVVRRARRPGRADDDAALTRLWTAVLEQALAPDMRAEAPDLALTRLQLQRALEADAMVLAPDDPLLGTTPAWRRLLQDDRAWLKATLQRLGRSQPLERRLARTLSTELLPEVASLWLATEQTAAVAVWISAAAAQAPQSAAQEQDYRRALWEAALSHFLCGEGDAEFDSRRFARKLLRRLRKPARTAMDDDARTATPALADWLRPGPAWWRLLREDGATLRAAVRQHVRRGAAQCRQLAHEWSGDMLLESVCLQAPQARQLIAAAVTSPPVAAGTRERRWASTLQFVYARDDAGPVDERAYLEFLARDAARAAGHGVTQVVAHWSAAVLDPAAAPAWFERIGAVAGRDGAPQRGDSAPATAGAPALPRSDAQAGTAPGGADAAGAGNDGASRVATAVPPPVPLLLPLPLPVPTPVALPELAADGPAQPRPAGPRTFAGRVVAALAALAGGLGRRVGRVFGADPPSQVETAPVPGSESGAQIEIDNAGLVLIGPYLPRLFEALGMLAGQTFADDRARERAPHLLQYAVDGAHEAAAESRLVLNKLLCGLAPDAVVGRRCKLTQAERTLVDDLLGAVIEHWSILGRTTPAGLRETFLQRRGHLERRADGGWTLSVEPGAFDILIDRLPWGYAMQKHGWMSEALHVEWR